jgi:anti-anti-sigma factor
MELKVTTEAGRVPVTVVHVDGNLDSATYHIFQQKAEELVRAGARHILVDLAHAPFVSSAGLRALHTLFNDLRAAAGEVSDQDLRNGVSAGTYKSRHLKLLNPSKETAKTLNTAGFDMFLEVHTDLRTAIDSF